MPPIMPGGTDLPRRGGGRLAFDICFIAIASCFMSRFMPPGVVGSFSISGAGLFLIAILLSFFVAMAYGRPVMPSRLFYSGLWFAIHQLILSLYSNEDLLFLLPGWLCDWS
jgi:hypothetical protein